jgi:hypothetical protein
MTHHLVVTRPFLQFVRGDLIADATKVAEILASDYRKFVNKVVTPANSKG